MTKEMKKKICFSILLILLVCSNLFLACKRFAEGIEPDNERGESYPENLSGAVLTVAEETDEADDLTFVGNELSISTLACSKEEVETIKKERIVTEEDLILELKFNNYALPRTRDGVFFYSLIENEVNAYNPGVSFSGADPLVQIQFDTEYITDEMIGRNESVTILAFNEKYYRTYTLVCTTLPVLNIVCDLAYPIEDTPMQFYLFDNRENIKTREIFSYGTMHLRGRTSMEYDKKGYKISLKTGTDESAENRKESLLGMRKDDDWILYAGYNDIEKIRNVFSANLWKYSCAENNAFGLDNGYEYRFVEMLFNGEYYGLYALGYKVDSKVVGLREFPNEEYLFKKIDWDNEFNSNLYNGCSLPGYELTEGTDSGEAWKVLKSYFHLFMDAENSRDAIQQLYSAVDIDNSIDILLFLNLIQGIDNAGEDAFKNLYLTLKYDSDHYVVLFTPWDMDYSWGSWWEDQAKNKTVEYFYGANEHVIMPYNAAMRLVELGDERIKQRIAERYYELRMNQWSEERLNEMIDEYEKQIFLSGCYIRDMQRWPDGCYEDPNLMLSKFRSFVMERMAYMDKYVAALTAE